MIQQNQEASRSKPLSKVEKLSSEHTVSVFTCGKPVLDEWLHRYALTNQRNGVAQTYVVHRSNTVVGYYSLSAGSVTRNSVPTRIAKGIPNYPVPVALLGRLAIDRSERGKGLGAALLKDAMLRVNQAAGIIGVRALLVHALDEEARAFYEHFNFVSSPLNEMQLMFLMKDLRAILSGE